MGFESSDVDGFDLGPLLEGHMRIDNFGFTSSAKLSLHV